MDTSDDPITLAIIAAATVGTVAQIQQGRAADAQAKSQQDILEHNARIAETQADEERRAAAVKAKKFQAFGEELKGEQRVGIARAGVLATEGSPALLLEETAFELEGERREILRTGFIRGGFQESQATGLRFQGSAARARGSNIRRGSQFSAAGTLLTGLGTAGVAQKQLEA